MQLTGSIFHVYTQTIADDPATSIVRPSDWNSLHKVSLTMSLDSNDLVKSFIVGTNTITKGALQFSNGNGFTFGSATDANGLTVTGSYTTPSQSAQTIGLYGVGNTTQNSSTTLDARTLSFDGLGAATVGFSNGSVQISVAVQSAQSAIRGLGASNTGNTAGNTGLSSGVDWVVAGSNNITISESTVGGGPNTLWISGPSVGGAQTGISGVGVSDTTYTSGTVILSAQANITIGSSVNGASQYARLSVAAQSVQSAIKGFGASNTGNTAGNTGISSGVDWVVAGSNNITISESTVGGGPNTIWVSGPSVAGAQTGISGVGVSDTTYASGTVILSAQANITIGSSVNGASQYARFSVAAQSIQTMGLYAVGNTTQGSSTTLDARTLSFDGLGQATVGFNNGSVQISVTSPVQSAQTLGVYGVGNTTLSSSGTLDARSLSFSMFGPVSEGYSNGSVVLSVDPALRAAPHAFLGGV